LVDSAPKGIGDEQAGCVRSLGDILRGHGHEIVACDVAELDRIAAECDRLVRIILSTGQASWLDSLGIGDDEVHPVVAEIAEEGRRLSAVDLFSAETGAAKLAHACWRLFADIDVLVTPVLSRAPVQIGSLSETHPDADTLWAFMASYAPRAAIANICGLPAVSVPRGLDEGGLPLAAQLSGPIGSDLLLLHLASQIEGDAPWPFPAPILGSA
jgi:amidase